MKLSIVIVNYNVRYFLEQCLRSVQKATGNRDDIEIFVVDNHSVDRSQQMVREKFPRVKLIESTENLGFSKGNNLAIRQATGEYILLLNPDTLVQEDTLEKCIRFMDAHPDAGALGVKMIDGKGKFLPESKRGLPTPEVALYKILGLNKLFPGSRKFGKYHLGYLSENETNEVEVLSGAFMFIRKSVLDETGLLDEDFFMYGEDIDLSYRITKAGYKNYYFPETSIIHYKGESTKRASVNYVLVFYRAMIIFSNKHYRGGYEKLLNLLISLAIYLRAAVAIGYRFFQRSWLILTDIALIVPGMYLLKLYWEIRIKGGESYPPELMTIHVPYYTFLWVLCVYLSGGYEEPPSVKRILRGLIIGTVLIAAVYGLFPNHLRFSRALIILGAIIAAGAMIGIRLVRHFIKYKNLDLGMKQSGNTVIVGGPNERKRVYDLMSRSGTPAEFLGFISTDEKEQGAEILGNIHQLDEIARIYKVHDIIFCASDIPSSTMIGWMSRIGTDSVHFKIVPDESYFIIGSDSRNSTGELYSEEIKFALQNPYNRRKKRLLDLLAAIALIVFSPVLILFVKNRKSFYGRCVKVLFGKYAWVGYHIDGSIAHLPEIKPGIFSPLAGQKDRNIPEGTISRLNFLYARNYTAEQDISLIISGLFGI